MHQEHEGSEMELIEAVKRGDLEAVRKHVDGVSVNEDDKVPWRA